LAEQGSVWRRWLAEGKVRLRAEELSAEELVQLSERRLLSGTAESLKRRLTEPDPCTNPTVLAGPKGVGKTFAALAAAISLPKPVMFYVYRARGKVEEVGRRFGLGGSGSPKAYVFDDVHYLCEDVAAGVEGVGVLEGVIRRAVEAAERGVPVLLISENLPHVYFREMGLAELAACSEKFTYAHLLLVEPPSFEEWRELVEAYGIEADDEGLEVVYWLSPRPRFFLRLASEAGGLSLPSIMAKAAQLIRENYRGGASRLLKKLEEMVVDIPSKHLQRVASLGKRRIEEMEMHLDVLRAAAGTLASTIRREHGNPYDPSTHHHTRWERDNAFTIRAFAEMRGFPVEAAVAALTLAGVKGRSFLSYCLPLLHDYCTYGYEEIRESALKYLKVLDSSHLIPLSRARSFNPRILLRVFSGYMERSSSEIIKKLLASS